MDLQALKNKYDIIGNDPALNQALETAVKFAPTDLTRKTSQGSSTSIRPAGTTTSSW